MPGQLGSSKIQQIVRVGAARPLGYLYRPSGVALAETLVWSDSGTGTITLAGSAAQSQSHSASGTASLTVSGSASATLIYADSRAGSLTLSGSQTQTHSHSRSGSGSVTVNTGAISESHSANDFSDAPAPSIEFSLSGSRTESESHTASRSGSLTLSGSSSQSQTHSSSRSGSLTLSGTAVEHQSFGYTDAMSGTITLGYVHGTAYPGDFFPGQVYPGQTVVSTPSRDSHTRSGTTSWTLSGSGSDVYSFGATVTHDAGVGTLSLTGSIAMESLGALDSTSGREGQIRLSGSATSHQSWQLVLTPTTPGVLAIPLAAVGSLTLTPVDPGVLPLVPAAEGTLPLDPVTEGTLILNPV